MFRCKHCAVHETVHVVRQVDHKPATSESRRSKPTSSVLQRCEIALKNLQLPVRRATVAVGIPAYLGLMVPTSSTAMARANLRPKARRDDRLCRAFPTQRGPPHQSHSRQTFRPHSLLHSYFRAGYLPRYQDVGIGKDSLEFTVFFFYELCVNDYVHGSAYQRVCTVRTRSACRGHSSTGMRRYTACK